MQRTESTRSLMLGLPNLGATDIPLERRRSENSSSLLASAGKVQLSKPGQLQVGINLDSFNALLARTRVNLGNDVPVKEAYQHFKRLESSRMRNNLDATPEIVLSIMQDQMRMVERRASEDSGSVRRLVRAPSNRDMIPPPPKISREESLKRLNNNNSTNEVIGAAQDLAQNVQRVLRRGASDSRLLVENAKRAPEIMPKRNSLGSAPARKPPPPSHPPPQFIPLGKHRPPPSALLFGRQDSVQDGLLSSRGDGTPKPRQTQLMPSQQLKAASVSPSLEQAQQQQQEHQQPQQQQQQLVEQGDADSRQTFVLREKVNALENQLAKAQQEKNRIRQHLLQSQRDLHLCETNLEESESALAAARQSIANSKVQQEEQNAKVKSLQLDYKCAARKSRQRFDAAIDFMKAMLVDADFKNLLQVIKSRLRIIVAAERAELYIVDKENNELVSYREKKNSSTLWKGRFPIDAGIVGTVIEEKTMQVSNDVENDTRFDPLVDGIGSNGVSNLIAYPVIHRQEVQAVLLVVNKLAGNGRVNGKETFSDADIAAVQDFATLSTLSFLNQNIRRTRQAAKEIQHSDHHSD